MFSLLAAGNKCCVIGSEVNDLIFHASHILIMAYSHLGLSMIMWESGN